MELYLRCLVEQRDQTLGLLLNTYRVYGMWPYETGRLTEGQVKLLDHRDGDYTAHQAALARWFPSLPKTTTEDNKVCFSVRLRAADPIIGVLFHDGNIWIGGTPVWVK